MRIGIVGAGHVGLVTGAALASLGHDVVAIDVDAAKVGLLNDGKSPFFEPRLDDLLASGVSQGRLRFSTEMTDSIGDPQAIFICVGRPPTAAGDRSLTAVEAVALNVAAHASDGVVVVEKSTVPPGTADRLRSTIARERPALDFSVVANPEFLREGHAVDDTLRPARIVVGADDERGALLMRTMYAPMIEQGSLLLETDIRSAELAKLASNAFLATKISFVNSLARLAELTGADVEQVARVMGTDPRIAPAFLSAGLGYGGYCLPKDVVNLERFSERAGFDFGLLRETRRVNESATQHLVQKVEETVWNLEGKRIALLGLAFKPNTDDVRGAPALELARRFLEEGATVVGHDPMATSAARAEVGGLEVSDDPIDAATGAHCVVLCTEWEDYRSLDLDRLRSVMAHAVFVDGRNMFEPERMRAAGFTYLSTGRPTDHPG